MEVWLGLTLFMFVSVSFQLSARKRIHLGKVHLDQLYNKVQTWDRGQAEKSLPVKSIGIHLPKIFFILGTSDFSWLTHWRALV